MSNLVWIHQIKHLFRDHACLWYHLVGSFSVNPLTSYFSVITSLVCLSIFWLYLYLLYSLLDHGILTFQLFQSFRRCQELKLFYSMTFLKYISYPILSKFFSKYSLLYYLWLYRDQLNCR